MATLAILLGVVSAVCLWGSARAVGSSWAVRSFLLVLSATCFGGVFAFNRLRWPTRLGAGQLRVDDSTLHLSGARGEARIDREDIVWGATRDNKVDFQTADGSRFVLDTPSAEQAEALVSATGTNVDQRAVTWRLRGNFGPFLRSLGWFVVLWFPCIFLAGFAGLRALGKPFAMLLATGMSALLSIVLTKWFAPTVTIGTDGVLVTRGPSRRLIPHDSILAVKPGPQSLTLCLESESVLLANANWKAEDVDRVVTRLDHAKHATGSTEQHPGATFARRGQTIDEWRAQLRRMLSADPSFRRRPISSDDAARVLADPAVAVERRVGAALALCELDREGAEQPIRFAAEATADAPVRIALLSTLEEDAQATEEALALAAQEQAEVAHQ